MTAATRYIRIFSLLIVALLFLFSLPTKSYALYNPNTGGCEGTDSVEYLRASVCEENGKGPPPAVQCNKGDPDWIFSYPVCKVTTIQGEFGSNCDFAYEYSTSSCSATDTCRSTQYLYPAICSESSYDPARGPSSACLISGSRYKVCCTSSGQFGPVCQGGSYSGSCPNGTVTKFCGWGGYPSCDDPNVCGGSPPPPPPTCSEQLTCEYAEPDSTCPSGYRVVTGTGCEGFNCGCSYLAGCSTSTCAPGAPAPTPTPDTEAPTCNNLALSATHGCPGQRVTITGSTSDNVEVTNMEFFRNPASLVSYYNSLHSNPFTQSYEWDTSGLAQGIYTIVVNAQDAAGNPMEGLKNSCNKQYTVDSPTSPQCQAPWVPPSCSGSSFVGCNLQGQAKCTDYGTPQNATCADACTRSNPNTYCSLTVACSGSGSGSTINWTANPVGSTTPYNYSWSGTDNLSGSSQSVSKTYSTSGTKSATVTVTSNNPLAGLLTASNTCSASVGTNSIDSPPQINKSSASAPWPSANITGTAANGGRVKIIPGTSCTTLSCPGWTDICTVSAGSYSCSYTLAPSEPAGTYTYGLFDTAVSQVLATDTTNYTVTTTAPPPPPPPSGCTVAVSPGTVPPGGTVSVSIPTGPEGTYYLTCPDGSSRGPGARTASWMCSTSGLDPGTYSIDARGPGVSCSTNVNVRLSEADCKVQDTWSILGYAFNDPSYDANTWPAYAWNQTNSNTCWNYSNPYGSLPQSSNLAQSVSQGAVLAAQSCNNNNDCNDNKACTNDSCQNACVAWGDYGSCTQYAKQCFHSNVAYGTSCGISPTGGNMYCGGNYGTRAGDGICYDTLCKVNNECGDDGNICTTEQCNNYQPADPGDGYRGPAPERLGTCYPSYRPSATVCGASPTGGNKYCDSTGNCLDTLCRTNSDCGNDSNICTKDICSGYQPADPGDGYRGPAPERLGTCYPPEPRGFVCGTSPNGGAMYCDGNKVCTDQLCKVSSECNDNNTCTNDACNNYQPADPGDGYRGPAPESMGTCQYTNVPPYSVCSRNADNSPAKMCSYEPTTNSQCNIDYISCTNPKQNDQNCCGTTNIQGKQCQGSCYDAPFPYYNLGGNPAIDQTQAPALAGIVVHADGNLCGISYTATTNSSGYAYFSSIARTVGRRSDLLLGRVDYTVWAEIPNDDQTQFSRGTCYNISRSGPLADSVRTVTKSGNKATCNRRLSGGGSTTGFSSFGFSQILPAWIQTTGGDVHSNTGINTPGGP